MDSIKKRATARTSGYEAALRAPLERMFQPAQEQQLPTAFLTMLKRLEQRPPPPTSPCEQAA